MCMNLYMRSVFICLGGLLLSSCDVALDADISFSPDHRKMAIEAYMPGVFYGRDPVRFCPERIVIEEQRTNTQPKKLWSATSKSKTCRPQLRWVIALGSPGKGYLFDHYRPRGPISVSVFTERLQVGGTGWINFR